MLSQPPRLRWMNILKKLSGCLTALMQLIMHALTQAEEEDKGQELLAKLITRYDWCTGELIYFYGLDMGDEEFSLRRDWTPHTCLQPLFGLFSVIIGISVVKFAKSASTSSSMKGERGFPG